MSKPIIILGAGGHAKVIAEAISMSGNKVIGCVTPDLKVGHIINNLIVLGDDSFIFQYSVNDIELVNGIGSLPAQNLRWNLTKNMREHGYKFASVIHPRAIVSDDIKLSEGIQIMAGVVIQAGTSIGTDSIINSGVIIDHDCTIGANCHLAPGVVCSGNVTIGKNVHVGTGSKIIQSINIGADSVVAAGSTIYKDVPEKMLVKQKLTTVIERFIK